MRFTIVTSTSLALNGWWLPNATESSLALEAPDHLATAAPLLFVCYGAFTLNNLTLTPVTFLGSALFGYGPRYALVDTVAKVCLFMAALSWAHAAVAQTYAGGRYHDPTTSRSLKADAKAIGIDLAAIAMLLVLAGILMEYVRHAPLLPWGTP